MLVPRIRFVIVAIFALLLGAGLAVAQTFEIQNQPGTQPQTGTQKSPKPAKRGRKGAKGAAKKENAQGAENGIGWGSSIEVGRMARAAEQAIHRGNYAAASGFAQRAVQAAPQDARLWYLLGYTARLSGKYQDSLNAYQRGLQSNPNNPDGLSGMAQTYAKAGNNAEAINILQKVIAAHPERTDDMLILGEFYIQGNQLQPGLQLLQRAEARKPTSHAELLMALAYMRLKEPAKAKQLLDMAKRRDPRNVEISRAVANYFREEKDYPSAIITLKNAPRQTPEVLGDLAFTYQLSGDQKLAAATYAQAAKEDPKNIRMQLSAAQAQFELGDVNAANGYLKKAQALDANNYRLHAIRAAIARLQERPQDAIKEYEFALSHMPQGNVPEGGLYPVLLRLNLSELYKQNGNQRAAEQQMALAQEEINKLQIEGPQKAEFLRVRASIKEGSGDYAGAEADLNQAMQLDPKNTNARLEYASLLWKTKRIDQARKIYADVLSADPKNRYALESMGYLSRDAGDPKTAEMYFNRLAAAYPDDFVAYLALGDMFTATKQYDLANSDYEKAFARAPHNAVIVANGANAAMEAKNVKLMRSWLDRAKGDMNDDARVMRGREEYLFLTGNYLQSARMGYQVLKKAPTDRNASVYLGYALYNLGRYSDVLALATQYEQVLPKEPNFPLLAGHVHRQAGLLDEAADDFTRTIATDPKMAEGYVNRGYVENDLQQGNQAAQDFQTALQIAPTNGVAHLGLSFAELELHHGKLSLTEADAAQKQLGDTGAIHLAKATAYRQMRSLRKADQEYQAAIKFAPDDPKLYMARADTLYYLKHYSQALGVLQDALQLDSEDSGQIYAQMAHNAAELHRRSDTLKYVQLAERDSGDSSEVLIDTGDALLTLGDRDAAMQRFSRALDAPDADRVAARLAIARLFVKEGKWDDAREQVGLAFAEARVGEAEPVTADDLVSAANIFLNIQDFDLARRYFALAQKAGAGDESTAVGIANSYLAEGDSARARKALMSLGNPADHSDNYDYNLALGNVYRQQQDEVHALTAFARANELSGETDDTAERALMDTAADEGLPVGGNVSFISDNLTHAIFDDPTIYEMDAKLLGATASPALLPTPRSSQETLLTDEFKYNQFAEFPIHGFFQLRNAVGTISLPSDALILHRNTRDYNFNTGVGPTLHFGKNFVQLDFGTQFTIRRDSASRESAITMNQDLFRQYLYLTTNSFGSWLGVRADGYHEAGPFTDRPLRSSDLGGRLEFVLGRPWSKTNVVTGYSARDLQFSPLIREYFTTSSYAGLEHKFGTKVKLTALGEYIRSWRVQDFIYATAQALRPAGDLQIFPNNRWSVEANFAYNQGEGFHAYDNVQGGFYISYSKPLHHSISDGTESVPVEYPLRISVGLEQQQFFNFTGRDQTQLRPVVQLTLF
jgi:tetratricopeptide (TPR) repeat protein